MAGIDMRWPAGIINIIDCENVSITGTGTIDGQGVIWWQRFWAMTNAAAWSAITAPEDCAGWFITTVSARAISCFESQKILLRDFTSRESGSGTYTSVIRAVSRLRVCKSAILRGRAPTGLTLHSCEQVRIERCIVSCNDDNICIKSGRGREAAKHVPRGI
ncbi:glycosyl hydrolase family 28 protein [Enterobacter hormaechei]